MEVLRIINKVPVSEDMLLSFEIPKEFVNAHHLSHGAVMDVVFDMQSGEIIARKTAQDYFSIAQNMAIEAKKPCYELFVCYFQMEDISGKFCMRCYGNCQDAVERYNLKHSVP